MPEYEKDLVSDKDKKSFTKIYTIYDKDRSYGAKSEEEAKENLKLSFEKLYKKYGEDWNSNTWKKNSNGEWFEYSKYNPNSKWDWYQVGGRWSGMLKVKKGKTGEMGEKSWCNEDEEIDEDCCDQVKKGYIDFSPDKKKLKESSRFWELVVEEKPLKKGEEKPFSMYKKEYYTERYKDKKTYARINSEFGTFAVLKDGEWFEKGEMGWFGCSSETNKEAIKWDNSFFDKFIKDLSDETLLTVVDCHI